MMDATKYAPGYYPVPAGYDSWVKKDHIEKAPAWCSVDLRDGNQALIVPCALVLPAGKAPKKNRRKTALTLARMPETAAQKTAAQECSGLFMPRLPDPSGVPFFFAAMSQCFKYLFSKV